MPALTISGWTDEYRAGKWNEAKHPRRPDGKFGTSGGSAKKDPEYGDKVSYQGKEYTVLGVTGSGSAALLGSDGERVIAKVSDLDSPSGGGTKKPGPGDRVKHQGKDFTVLGVTESGKAALLSDDGQKAVVDLDKLSVSEDEPDTPDKPGPPELPAAPPAPEPEPSAPATPDAGDGIGRTGPDPTESQLKAVQTYAGQGYLDINYKLRNGESYHDARMTDRETDQAISQIDGLMKKHRTTSNTVVYRGVSNLGPIGPGVDLDDEGFQSSTPDLDTAREFGTDILRIQVPAGSKAVNLSELTGTGEQELLIDRGGTLTVTDVQDQPDGTRIIDVTLEQY